MKPKFTQTNGIILRTRRLDESDLLLSILTQFHGKIEAKARGARRPRAKLRSLNSPFATASFEFVEGKKIPTITGLKIQTSRQDFATDLNRHRLAATLCELLDHTLQPSDPTPSLYTLLHHTLDQLLIHPHPILPFSQTVLRILTQLGFCAPVKKCSLCQTPITGEHIHLTPHGLACSQCHSDLHCSLDVAKILHFLQTQTHTQLNITSAHSSELLSHLRYWIESLTSHPLRSLS